MPLTIHGDVRVDVDGVTGRLVGDGSALRLSTDRPAAMLRALSSARHALPAEVPALVREGAVPLHVEGPRGRVLTVDVSSDRPLRAARVRPDRLLDERTARVLTVGVAIGAILAIAIRSGVVTRP